MYLKHFGLAEPPFTITPVTGFFYSGANRGATLEALIYAIVHGEGIVKVTGEVGSGKTMLCRVLMERLPANVETIYLANPSLSREEVLCSIADELNLDLTGNRAAVAVRALQNTLIEKYAAGKRVVVLIDEAHAMPVETLEELRLLYNLESTRHKLLQIVLFGQTELDDMLALPQMRQLKDRITHHFTTQPFSAEAVKEYLMFRMRTAGYHGPDIFTPEAVNLIAKASGGLTRRVNIFADKSLLAAFIGNTHGIEAHHAKAAIEDSEPKRHPKLISGLAELSWLTRRLHWTGRLNHWIVGAIVLLVGVLLGWLGSQVLYPQPMTVIASAPITTTTAPPVVPVPAAPVVSPPLVPSPVPSPAPSAAVATAAAVAAAPAKPAPAPAAVEKRDAVTEVDIATLKLTGHKLLQERVEAAKKMMSATDSSYFSIQLFITNDVQPARMQRFLIRANSLVKLSDLYVYPEKSGGQTRFRVMYGIYPARDQAVAALAQLPQKYKTAFRPEMRSLVELH